MWLKVILHLHICGQIELNLIGLRIYLGRERAFGGQQAGKLSGFLQKNVGMRVANVVLIQGFLQVPEHALRWGFECYEWIKNIRQMIAVPRQIYRCVRFSSLCM